MAWAGFRTDTVAAAGSGDMFVAPADIFVTKQWLRGAARRPSAAVLMIRDSAPALGQTALSVERGPSCMMPSAKADARWLEAAALTLALWLFVLVIFLPMITARHPGEGVGSVLLDASTVFVSMALAMPLFALFRATLEWSNGVRLAVLLAAVATIAIFNTLFDLVWTGWVAKNLDASWEALPRTVERGYASALNYVLVFGVNLALFQVAFSRRWALTKERQLIDAETAAQQAQLAALRYQLNPHFLFNTLNSISALIVTRRNADAEQMTDKLSHFLRASLNTDPGEMVPLEEELALTEEYLDIEGVRFGDRLNVSIRCAPDAGAALVPSFLVQPLVENAIKHGVAPSRDPVRIRIGAEVTGKDLCIEVENGTSPVLDEPSFGAGVGLKNIRRRLQAVYGKRASLDIEQLPNRYRARICIPEVQRG
jgi:hypothetical protein